MISPLSVVFLCALTAFPAFCLGLWLGVDNGKRYAQVDATMIELAKIAAENMHATAENCTCVDMTIEPKDIAL